MTTNETNFPLNGNDENNTTNRPLSLYDNLSALTLNSELTNNTNTRRNADSALEKEEQQLPFNNILFKFHNSTSSSSILSLPSMTVMNKITNESNNNTIDTDNISTNHNDNKNDDGNDNGKTMTYHKGHLFTVNLNNNNKNKNNNNNNTNHNYYDNNNGTPVIANINNDKYFESNQYKNVSDALKVHRAKMLSDAKSSFFGLNATIPSSTITSSTLEQLQSHQNYQQPLSSVSSSSVSINTMDQSIINEMMDNNNSIRQNTKFDNIPFVSANDKKNRNYQNIPLNSACFSDVLNNINSTIKNVTDDHDDNYNDDDKPDETKENVQLLSMKTFDNRAQDDHQHRLDMNVSDTPESLTLQSTSLKPSQVVYMTTTVPQNIRGSNIMGRHKPTRSSLRHSRMIVENKNYQDSLGRNPLELSYPCLIKVTLIFQIIIGICTAFLALWILLWAPNTRTRDNPYWSGIMIITSGIISLILIEFRRVPRHRLREQLFKFMFVNSIVVTVVAMIFAFISLIFTSIHLGQLTSSSTTCFPANILETVETTCVCLFNGNGNDRIVELKTASEGEITAGGFEFQYRDLSCTEVRTGWTYILIISTALNLLGFTFALTFLLSILCCRRRAQ